MDFKIPVDNAQFIMSKLSSVAKLTSDDVDGLVLIEAGDFVKFSVNDRSVSLSIDSFSCEITKPGKILCKLDDFKSYLGKFTKLADDFGTEFFNFVVKDGVLSIKTKTVFRDSKPSYRKLVVPLLDTSIYPRIKFVEEAQLIVNSSILKEGIARVLHCVNPKEIRSSLKGIAITIKQDKLIFAATNGVKLSEAILDINTDSIEESTHIFKYGLASVLKYVLDPDSQVFISFEGPNVYIRCNELYITGSTIVNESFPNYRKALESFDYVVNVPRLSFSDSVSNAVDVLDVEDNSRLSVKLYENKMLLKNERVEIAQEFDNQFEHELDIDVNGHYLNDLLTNFAGATIQVCFKDANSPLILRSGIDDKHTVLLTNLRRR